MSKQQIARRAGDHLGNVLYSGVAEMLTPEERDWVSILRDRFYEIHRGRGSE